jgi:inner membrane protein
LSHLLLDWTNNYGLRPFFPFDPRWFAGSFVFIVEPVMLLLLAMAFIAPALFGLIGSEVGVRKQTFRGRGWAIAALVGIVVMYAVRYTEHGKAIEVATANQPDGTTRVFASPQPLNPFAWSVVSDTPAFYQLSSVDSRLGTVEPPTPSDTLYKPETTLGILAAKRTFVGRIYLDWSQYPVISEAKVNDDPNHPLTEVTFRDARFMTVMFGRDMRTNSPLTARVLLDMAAPPAGRVVEMKMGDRVEK